MTERSRSPVFDPPPRDERLAQMLQPYPASLFSDQLYRSIELMERYSIDLAIGVLDQLRVLDRLQTWRSAAELCQMLSFRPQFAFAMAWLCQRMVETGCVETRFEAEASGTTHSNILYRLVRSPWTPDTAHLRAIGLEIDSANAATLDLLDKAASLYPEVARGEQSGEQALFGAQGIPLWLNYFSNGNPTYAINNWIAAIAATERVRNKKSLRILELGAGAGSASEMLLRCLDEANALPKLERYVVTEPNAFFLRRGQRELSKRYPALPLQWRALDIDQDWSKQNITSGEFDLIYGVNVLHVAKDLSGAARQAREALAENGWLVIGECVRPRSQQPVYVELIFQLLDSFTNVLTDNEVRPNPGFLTAGQWHRLFIRAGFSRAEVTPDIHRIREVYAHFFTAAICGQNG